MPLVAISADEPEESRRFAKMGHIGFPLLRDEDLRVSDAYGVATQGQDIPIPALFIITQTGHIHYKKVGETLADRPDLDDVIGYIDALLAIEPPGEKTP